MKKIIQTRFIKIIIVCILLYSIIPLYVVQADETYGGSSMQVCGPTTRYVDNKSSYELTEATSDTTYPFQDANLPLETRVDDLIDRLTLDEKISLLHQWQPAIPRLGIASFRTGTEALHGVAWLGEATVFPQAIGLGSTWDPNLVKQIGSAVGDEVRVYHQRDPLNVGVSIWSPVVDALRDPRAGRTEEGYSEDPYLTGQTSMAYCSGLKGDDPFYYKTIPSLKHFYAYNQEANRATTNVVIDERNQHEYYLEFFRYAIASGAAKSTMTSYNLVNGVPNTVALEINSVVKTQWAPIDYDADFFVVTDAWAPGNLVSPQGYYPDMPHAYAGALKAGVDSMTQDSEDSASTLAYIRDAYDDGLITEADIDKAVRNILRVRFHTGEFDPDSMNPYANVPDSELCHPDHAALSLQAAREAVVLLKNQGNILPIDKNDINSVAVIGPLADELFNDFYGGTFPYEVTALQAITDKLAGKTIIYSSGNDKVALKALVNSKYVTTHGETSLIADSATIGTDQTFELDDWDFGQYTFKSIANKKYFTVDFDWPYVVTASRDYPDDWFVNEIFNLISKGGNNYLLKIWNLWANLYVTAPNSGVDPLRGNSSSTGTSETFTKELITDGLAEAVAAALSADIAIVFVGNCPVINGSEDEDRPYITLPPDQQELIEQMYDVNPNTIVVLVSSYPVAINWTNDNIPAIVYSSHGGQEMGTALADVLFGDYSPAGRLTTTWYSSLSQIPTITDYDIIDGNRTYMYFEDTPLYPFGHGLTYTAFNYSNLQLSSDSIAANEQVTVSVDVTNTGSVASDEVVQLYVKDVQATVKRPIKELLGFERVSIPAGETKTVNFTLPASELAFWDVSSHSWHLEEGYFGVMVGSSSADIRLTTSLYVRTQLTSADFESGFVEWVNVTGDTHYWTRNSGPTDTNCTGPSGGANGSNWYVYLETSAEGANSLGDTACLEGPEIGGSNRILTFYYHMCGANIGTLNVDVNSGGSWDNGVWSISGQQHSSSDDPYTPAIVDLSGYTGTIKIRFRAVAAGGIYGDTAIDDIAVVEWLYGDLTHDNKVDVNDLSEFCEIWWLENDCNVTIGLDLNNDCIINFYEFSFLARNWLEGI